MLFRLISGFDEFVKYISMLNGKWLSIIRYFILFHTKRKKKLFWSQTYTISSLMLATYTLDHGYSREDRFTVSILLLNDICEL
jgi:hypothetical protein